MGLRFWTAVLSGIYINTLSFPHTLVIPDHFRKKYGNFWKWLI